MLPERRMRQIWRAGTCTSCYCMQSIINQVIRGAVDYDLARPVCQSIDPDADVRRKGATFDLSRGEGKEEYLT